MPISLPIANPVSETQPLLSDWGAGLLMIWAIAMLFFGAIASFGQNTAFYESADRLTMF